MIIDSALTIQERRLVSLLSSGIEQARRLGKPVVASTVLRAPQRDPLAFFAAGARVAGERLFWSCPGAEYTIAGVGAAWSLELAGGRRFQDAAAGWRDICKAALIDDPFGELGTGPILMGGFSFDPLHPATPLWRGYPDGLLVLPRYTLSTTGDQCWLTINAVLRHDSALPDEVAAALRVHELFESDADLPAAPAGELLWTEDVPPAEQWKASVGSLERELRQGDLKKVVLARQLNARGERPFDPARVLGRLQASYADCFAFAIARGDSCFLSATPERLVRLRDQGVRATCLAGSIARGGTPEEDRRLGEELLASAKDRAEHAFVVDAICDALADACGGRVSTGALSLMKLRNVQHLFTPIVGHVASGRGVLDLVERLHPTPAVGGSPRAAALEKLRRFEGMDRGWYAAPVGWMDARGEGEFAVAIRSALLRGDEATLFAGCGIVAGSDPEREYAESCLKLRPMLSVLGR